MRLYDYTLKFSQLEELLQDESIDLETYQDTLQSIQGSADEKAENIGRVIDNYTMVAAALKAEEELLKKRRKTLENSIEWLTGSLEDYLKSLGKESHTVGKYTLKFKNLPPRVEITDEDELNDAYFDLKPTISKKRIMKALKDGEEVKGAVLVVGDTKFEVKK